MRKIIDRLVQKDISLKKVNTMGFSAQGKSAHEALVARQDSEIRLLELMKRCLLQKAKCDREYANAIANVSQQGFKIDKSDDLNGSQILQAWKKFMEEMENQSKLIRSNSEHLETMCTDRMSQMCQEKRKLKKLFQEEHAKIATRFYQLTEDVARKKAEYQKHLEYYKQMRMRFEEHYIKSGRAGRKLDDVRDKYQKACRKLHLAHNEYVLLLHEATEVEKDYRTILLPTLLAHQQTDQEQFINIWKNLLNDVAKSSDYTSSEYSSIQQHISNSINSIIPTDEYKDFADKYKSLPVIFRFDDNPNEENFGKLQPNQLAIDNLTIDSLRQRITELEQSIKECQEKQQKIAGEINGKKISTSSLPSTTSNSVLTSNSSNLNGVSNSVKDTKFNKDLCSLKCQERQMNKLVEIIRSSLNEVSINELPSGCDDIGVDIEKNLGNDENITTSKNLSIFLQKSGDFMTLIRTPFKKKRATVANDDTSRRSKSETPMTIRAATTKARCLSASSVNSCESNSNKFDVSSTNTENASNNNSNNNYYADINSDFEFDFNINSLFNDYDDYIDESELTENGNAQEIDVLETIEINECKHLSEEQVDIDESEMIRKIPDVRGKISKIHLPYIPKIFSFSSAAQSDVNVNNSAAIKPERSIKDGKKFFSFFKKKISTSEANKSMDLSDNVKIENEFIMCRRCAKQIIYSSKEHVDNSRQFQCSVNNMCNCEKNADDDGIYIKNSAYKDLTVATNRPIYEEEWFHGVLPREEVVRLLRNDGDFLVRETTRNDESQTVLSVCWNGHKHFIVQTTADGHFRFEGPSFPSIQELILHQFQSELPVTSRSGAILKTPIFKEHWELSNDDVILIDKIGRGNFGDVYKAKLKSSRQEVACKTCKHSLPDEQKRKFLQEGRILKQYDHPNIVKLIGICVQKQPIMIVMELVEGGSLLSFLRKNSATLDQEKMMGMCKDTAAGMRYLESKNCIHRDLAARNCLIGSGNIVKISDFGMSREEEEYIVSDGMKQIPIKWTAPEALNFGKYTSLCDVWSYGILVWEIFSKGGTPYPGLSNSKAREKIDEGYRMPMPEGTPVEMYKLMLKCWNENPEDRPHFDEIYTVVDCLMKKL